MPSSSSKQHRFMEAVAHNPAFAKKAGVPQSVGKDFSAADKGRTFSKGGADMDMKKPNPFMEMIAKKKEKAEGESPSFQKKEGKKGEKAEMKFAKGGGIESKGKTVGKVIRMASGGSVSSRADGIASRGKTNCKIC